MEPATLTQSRLRELFDYHADAGVFVRRVSVRGSNGQAGDVAGYQNHHGYVSIGVDSRSYSAHRLVWMYVYGEMPGGQIDHINGCRSDNRLANLRDVTPGENLQNQRSPRSNNKSGLLGVTKYHNRWRATIKPPGKPTKYIGLYASKEEAHAAYLTAKRLHHKGNTL